MEWVKYFLRMLFGLPDPDEPDAKPETEESVEQVIDLRTEWGAGE